jgi:hypothetical protein
MNPTLLAQLQSIQYQQLRELQHTHYQQWVAMDQHAQAHAQAPPQVPVAQAPQVPVAQAPQVPVAQATQVSWADIAALPPLLWANEENGNESDDDENVDDSDSDENENVDDSDDGNDDYVENE